MFGSILAALLAPPAPLPLPASVSTSTARNIAADVRLYGGPAFGDGSLSAFTQETRTSPRQSDARPLGTGFAAGGRASLWHRTSPWGLGADMSYLDLPVRGGSVQAFLTSILVLARAPERLRIRPYAGIGVSHYFATASADFTPPLASRVRLTSFDRFTYDARLGLDTPVSRHVSVFVEGRATAISLEDEWAPGFIFATRYRNGLKLDANVLMLSAGICFGAPLAGGR